MTVAVRELKNRLSAYLRLVRAGERVVVTDRGRAIAELGPVGGGRLTSDDRLQRLTQSGDVTPGRGLGPLADIDPIVIRGRAVSKTILDDRD